MPDTQEEASERLLLLHGADSFSRQELIRRLIADLGEEAGFNLTKLEGERLTIEEFQVAAMTPPFLGSRRLIIVEGLVARFQRGERGRRDASPDLGTWSNLAGVLQALPTTTSVIFNESVVAANNPLLRLIRPLVTAREFRLPRAADLQQWVIDRARRLGGQIRDSAARALISIAGDDLWVLHSELEKLTLFAEGQPITDEMVRLLASGAREANVFELVNVIVAHRRPEALRLLHHLLEQGVAPALLLFMLARQFRQLLRAVDLVNIRPEEALAPLGVNETWQAERALRQAREFGREGLLAAHSRLVDADLSIKTGRYSDVVALELLVIELSGARPGVMAPK